MGNPDQHQGWRTASTIPVLHLLFPGDPASVRRALNTAMAVFADMPPEDAPSDAVEIVLAEVLNNVVEHAYANQGSGLVELLVERREAALAFQIRDEGQPMPGGAVPAGWPHDLDVSAEDLPEGGFGWFLIHELTEDLQYRRVGNRNELTFRLSRAPETPEQ